MTREDGGDEDGSAGDNPCPSAGETSVGEAVWPNGGEDSLCSRC